MIPPELFTRYRNQGVWQTVEADSEKAIRRLFVVPDGEPCEGGDAEAAGSRFVLQTKAEHGLEKWRQPVCLHVNVIKKQ